MRIARLVLLGCAAGCGARNGDAHAARASDSVAVPATSIAPARDSASPRDLASTLDFYSAADLDKAAAGLARGTTTTAVFARRPDIFYVEARRTGSGVPEVHDDWSDVTTVQSGRATLHTGATVSGSYVESPGEHRGGTIDGGTRRAIAIGDFFVIPPGTPHQYEVASGDSIRYLTVKVRRAH